MLIASDFKTEVYINKLKKKSLIIQGCFHNVLDVYSNKKKIFFLSPVQ